MTSGAPTAPREALLSHRQILTILAGLMVGMFLAALDQTIVSTSIRTIADDLHGLSLQAWVTTAYLITSTVTTPLYGKLSDIYGRRPLFLTAITIFIFGSLACTFATSMYELAAFRAVQGIGAGGLFSLALAIIGDIVAAAGARQVPGLLPGRLRHVVRDRPVVGGFFAGADTILGITGWRWVFLVNVPIGIIALVVVAQVLHLPHTRADHRIDWRGAVALARRPRAAADRRRAGPRSGAGTRPRSIACYVTRRHRAARVHPGRDPDRRRRAAPAAALPQPGVQHRRRSPR